MKNLFQSTHPRRVRLHWDRHLISRWSFNPRTHVGCDSTTIKGSNRSNSFNPRTHVGCDPVLLRLCRLAEGFNPRTHVGCDNGTRRSEVHRSMFQSTHPRRVRQKGLFSIVSNYQFQSTHPRRVRQSGADNQLSCGKFQSTHPRRVRLP